MLVVLDVDSTLIEDEVIDLLAGAAGVRDAVAAVTESAMRGEIDFAESLAARVALLRGLPRSAVDDAAATVTVTAGVPALIEAVHAAGGRIAAVSGGFHEVLDPIADRLGLDAWRANRLEADGGVLTGRVLPPVIDAAAKRAALREWGDLFRVPVAERVAIGDGANDLLMLGDAALSIAFDAKPAVRAAAHVVLDGRDLTPVIAVLGLAG